MQELSFWYSFQKQFQSSSASPASVQLTEDCQPFRTSPHLSAFLQVSLKRSFARPTRRETRTSSPYVSCLGALVLSIRQISPSRRKRLLINVGSMSLTPMRFNTTSLLTKWSHLMSRWGVDDAVALRYNWGGLIDISFIVSFRPPCHCYHHSFFFFFLYSLFLYCCLWCGKIIKNKISPEGNFNSSSSTELYSTIFFLRSLLLG